MIISFSVKNFLSFKDEAKLNMCASLERIHSHHVVKTSSRSQPNLLRTAVIYGANASGKSNLVKAIAFVKSLVVEGINSNASIPIQRFRLDSSSLKNPTEFTIEFRVDKTSYSYTILVDAKRVQKEELSIISNSSENLLFSRTTSIDNKVIVEFGSFFAKLTKSKKQFLEFVALGTRSNQPFLYEATQRNVEYFQAAYGWFSDTLQVITPHTDYHFLERRLVVDEDFKNFVARFLKAAGTGITAIRTEEVNPSSVPDLPEELLQEVQESPTDVEVFMFVKARNGRRFTLTKKGDEISLLKLTTSRKRNNEDAEATFEIYEESDGTQRFFDLLPMLYDLSVGKGNRVYVVDEISRSLHPQLTQLIMDTHLARDNADNHSQLIITTHETFLLDLGTLRRDEIWFTEKQEDGSTDLYSLSDFQARYDKDVRRDYLIGRYGAIPFVEAIS
jgi:Predicted ATPases